MEQLNEKSFELEVMRNYFPPLTLGKQGIFLILAELTLKGYMVATVHRLKLQTIE